MSTPEEHATYARMCDRLTVLRKLPRAGAALVKGLKGENKTASRLIAVKLPNEDELAKMVQEACKVSWPKKDEIRLLPYKGGILPLEVGQLEFAKGELDDNQRAEQAVLRQYLEQGRDGFKAVYKPPKEEPSASAPPQLKVVPLPDNDQKNKWLLQHMEDLEDRDVGEDEIRVFEYKGGLYPFKIGEFFTSSALQCGAGA